MEQSRRHRLRRRGLRLRERRSDDRRCEREARGEEPDRVVTTPGEDDLAEDRAEGEASPDPERVEADRLAPSLFRGQIGDDRRGPDEDHSLADAGHEPQEHERGKRVDQGVGGDGRRDDQWADDDENAPASPIGEPPCQGLAEECRRARSRDDDADSDAPRAEWPLCVQREHREQHPDRERQAEDHEHREDERLREHAVGLHGSIQPERPRTAAVQPPARASTVRAVADGISLDELQLAARNHGLPLEALRFDLTPVGLHYLLTHYDIPEVDAGTWRLEVDGLVERPLSLSLDDLRARPSVDEAVTLECAGNGRALVEPHVVSQPWLLEAVGTARWEGAPLASILEEAGVREGAAEVLFTGLDRGVEGGEEQSYARSLPLDEALRGEVLLAYDVNGAPLPPQHGFPLRLVVPGWYGMTSVKWLARITVLDSPFDGYQMSQSYRLRHEEGDEGEPLSRMQVRSLMVPPGIPEFLTRARVVAAGECVLRGRAWSGEADVDGVEVSADGGETWSEAELEEASLGRWAWRGWSFAWQATAGEHELCCRARDAAGNVQPLDPPWNLGGYANNAVQRVPVTVTG